MGASDVISDIAGRLVYQEGIYVSSGGPGKVSYPDDGNEKFFSIEDGSYWFQHRNDCIKAIIQRFGIKGVVLDVGGGNGFVSKMLADIGLDPILVEPHIQGCRNAKQRGVRNIVCGCLEDLDLKRIKVDAVGIFDVLEHIDNEGRFLRSINSSLSDQGKLLLSVPAHSFLWSAADEQAGHCRRYSLKHLNDVLANNGFKIVFHSYFFNCLFVPVFLLRRLPYLLNKVVKAGTQGFNKSDYEMRSGLALSILGLFLRAELDQLRGNGVFGGTSMLVLAEKILSAEGLSKEGVCNK